MKTHRLSNGTHIDLKHVVCISKFEGNPEGDISYVLGMTNGREVVISEHSRDDLEFKFLHEDYVKLIAEWSGEKPIKERPLVKRLKKFRKRTLKGEAREEKRRDLVDELDELGYTPAMSGAGYCLKTVKSIDAAIAYMEP